MEYNYKPRPEKYNGRIYRSKLEAKYARLFDILDFKFEYEPETALDGWLIDFMVIDHFSKIWFVEVKPMFAIDEKLKAKLMRATNNATNVLIASENPNIIYKHAFGESPINDQNFVFEYEGEFYRDFGHAAIFREKKSKRLFIESVTKPTIYQDGAIHPDIENVSALVGDQWNRISNRVMFMPPLSPQNNERYGTGL